MKPWIRMLLYLVLNILVSGVTTFLVLTWWDRTHRIEVPITASSAPVASAPTQAAGNAPAGTAIPAGVTVIEIKNVFGVGDLQNEVVVIKRVGDGELSLARWTMEGSQSGSYTFPDLVLNKDGAVQIYSRSGVDTVIELFWGLEKAAWASGEQITLVDPQGTVRATYTIP
jgi:hypothetical protein